MLIIKKVLFVATVVKTHIAAFHLPYLKWFKKMGYETHVCAKNDYDDKGDCSIPYCDKYYDLPFQRSPFRKNNVLVYHQLKKIIDSNNYDVIHCHTPMGGVLTRLAAREARREGTRVIYTAHGFHFYKGAPFYNRLFYYPVEKLLAGFTDGLVTINKEDYEAAKNFRAKKVFYVPGVGIDVDRFSDATVHREVMRRELGIGINDFALLSVGELIKRKNHRVILRALAEINNPGIVYLLCGGGELCEYLKKEAEALKVNVKFLGFRKDIPEICAAADLFVLPSYQEGLPVALMEAMASRLPVICSAIRGNTDLIENGKGGYLIEPDDAEGLAKSIEYMLVNPDKRTEMGMYNYKKVKEYDSKIVQKEMEKIYAAI